MSAIRMKRSLSRKEWNLLGICLIMLIVVLCNVGVRHYQGAIASILDEVSTLEVKLGGLIKLKAAEDRINRSYARRISQARKLKDTNEFIRRIQAAAQGSGFGIRDIKPAEPVENAAYSIFRVQIESEETFADCIRFLKRAAGAVDGFTVSELSVTRQGTRTLPRISLSLSAVGFPSSGEDN